MSHRQPLRASWRQSINLGDQLDHYRLDAVVSRERTTTVFQATDLQTNQQVSLKVPHAGVEIDAEFFDRFHREEEIGASLSHPGLLKLLHANEHHSRPYLVTEWFEGKTLRAVLREEKKLPPKRAISIALALCDVLSYIHNHGVVHRNLKPENILVGVDGRVKLVNFDAAAKEGSTRLTFASLAQLVGGPYISPEELAGKRGDARSDIYSLGVVLYEMLTGALPFPGTDPFDRFTQEPIPPRRIEPSISPQLQEVIYRALEREHKNRYASAHDLAHDLRHLDQVGVRPRLPRRSGKPDGTAVGKIARYAALVAVPILIFALLLYFSRH